MFIEDTSNNIQVNDDDVATARSEYNHSTTNLANISPQKNKAMFFDKKITSYQISLFFGKSYPHLITGGQSHPLPTETFGPIIVNPEHSNLYTAWEAQMTSNLEDFKDNQGQLIQNAVKIDWITDFP